MQWSEARLLGYMGYEVLGANTDLDVNDEIGLGDARQCSEAVSNGEVDFYHRYTGGAWATIPPQHDEVIADPDELYERTREEMEEEHGATAWRGGRSGRVDDDGVAAIPPTRIDPYRIGPGPAIA